MLDSQEALFRVRGRIFLLALTPSLVITPVPLRTPRRSIIKTIDTLLSSYTTSVSSVVNIVAGDYLTPTKTRPDSRKQHEPGQRAPVTLTPAY